MSSDVVQFVDDDALLRAFCENSDQQAFAELVTRYIGVVYASARRQVNEEHLAEDVTQAVFILLARKCKSLLGKARAGRVAGERGAALRAQRLSQRDTPSRSRTESFKHAKRIHV
jgi:hypothetical protein